jgi:hypothetical protein
VADRQGLELGGVVDLLDAPRRRIERRVGRVEPVGVRQQHEPLGAQQHGDLRGEEVVVAEGDLVGGGGVVLVDDRDGAPLEQAPQRLARVEVVGALAHVVKREQHLGGQAAALAQQLVVDVEQAALADGACRLEVGDRRRTGRQLHHPHPARDCAARDDDRTRSPRDLVADRRQDLGAQLAVVGGGDARAELDDDRAHSAGSSSKTTPPISTSSPGSNPSSCSAWITPEARQAVLDVGHRLLVLGSKRASSRSTRSPSRGSRRRRCARR